MVAAAAVAVAAVKAAVVSRHEAKGARKETALDPDSQLPAFVSVPVLGASAASL